mgnify:CR=1 FL=1
MTTGAAGLRRTMRHGHEKNHRSLYDDAMSPDTPAPERPDLPGFHDVLAAAARIAPHAQPTPVLRSRSLDALAGCTLHFKCENLQRVGAFKFRGACNAVMALDAAQAARGVVTHSSGNHGAAVALACRLRGIAATVVVPEGAAQAKVQAMQAYGARLVRCPSTQAARDAATADVLADTGGVLVHPFDDARVIAGQGTAALELLQAEPTLDTLVVPMGGGGLLSGTLLAAQGVGERSGRSIDVFAAEPAGAAEGHASLARGERMRNPRTDTLCDGLRADIGARPFALMRQAHAERRLREVLCVDDADTVAAMRLLWERLKVVVEPSAAIAFAAVLRQPQAFAGRHVGVIMSGGNLDLERLPWAS